MKLESQVCSLSLSKELKSAGYKQEGLVYWVEDWQGIHCQFEYPRYAGSMVICIAPTVAELGERLPEKWMLHRDKKDLFRITYMIKWKETMLSWFYADTEANARAKMWLYLKKENLI